jgi:hypothetical protein
MKANPPERILRRVSVILGPGGSSRNLLDVVLPLLGRDKSVEMQGVFLEEAELKHAAELPFVKELCRVTFSVREFNSDQFDRVLALRMRTAQRALSVLAKRAGIAHSFRNVRGSAVSLLLETANQSDVTVFEPIRTMAAAMSSRPYKARSAPRIVVAFSDLESGSGALVAASALASGDMSRLTVLLTPAAAADVKELEHLVALLPACPGRVRTMSRFNVGSLIELVQSEAASMLVLGATAEFMDPDILRILRQRLRCPVCLVRYWGDNG